LPLPAFAWKWTAFRLWRGNHVAIRQLVDDFGRYLYLPRLQTPAVLINAIRSGLALLTWEHDAFAYAESYDDAANRYRGLLSATQISVTSDDPGLLVRPEAAKQQTLREAAQSAPVASDNPISPLPVSQTTRPSAPPPAARPKRYHGTVNLDPTRVGRDAGRIADEVITHLAGLIGSSVRVTLEIEAGIPDGAPDNVVRTVTENGRTLKFANTSGFETE
jgi:hypothetical protein